MFDAGTIAGTLILDRAPFHASLDAARAEAAKGVHVPVTFDVSQNAAMRAVVAARAVFRSNPITIPITFTVSQAQAMAGIVAARAAFRANPITVPIGFSVSQAAILRTVAAARALLRFSPIPIPVTLSVSPAEMARVGATLQAWFIANPVVIPVRLGTPAGGLGNLGGGGGLGGLGGLLGKKISLFGGAFGTTALIGEIALWHILVDWVVEFAAVLIPAAVALGAFGIAGAQTAKEIYTNFRNVSTIATATGRNFNIITGGFAAVQAAVRPKVLQLWGDALTIITQKGSGFRTLAVATGTALDQLGARFTVAITNGRGFGGIMAGGAQDVAKLGDVVGNLGGALGNVLRAMPGFANDFLDLWVAASKGVEVLSSISVPALNLLLWAHGLILYGGLAVTAIIKLGPAFVAAGGAVYDFTLMAAANIGVFIADVIAAQGAVATFAVISDALTPWGWIAIGVAAIAGLTYLIISSRTQTEKWLGTLQAGIMDAQTVANGMAKVGVAQVDVSQRLADAHKKLAAAAVAASRGSSTAFIIQADAIGSLESGTRQLSAEQNLSRYRLAQLTQAYGSQHHAMGLLAAAGITEKQWLTKNASTWAQIRQQVAATEMGYVQMGVTGGALGNDLQVMNRQVTAQYQAMTKLNGALDAWIKDVTGSQSAFDGFAQGFATLAKNEAAAGATMDGLNASSITLNSSFATQVTNANALFDTWRLAGVASNLQVKGIKAAVASLLPFAHGSREATAQLVALAEQAGYDGPASMQRLNLWLGKTHGSLATLKQITNQATMQEALLSGAMRGQGNLIANQLLRQLNEAIIKYGGVSAAVQAYGKAIATQGAQSDAARQARAALIQDLITTGQRAGESAKQIGAMITKITGIPPSKAVSIVVKGTGSYVVTGQSVSAGPSHRFQAAKGAFINAGTPGVDDQLVLAQRGELVVPTSMVRAGAVDHLRGRIPGFATGGVVGSFGGSPSALGSFDVKEYNATTRAIEAADAGAAAATIRADIAKARAILAGFSGGATGSAIARYAESFIGKVPYVWGGTTTAGWDCSGFTDFIYQHFGYNSIPRTAAQQQQWAQHTASPVAGGLAFFAGADGTASAAGHVGIIVNPTTMVDAYGTGFGTRLNALAGSSGASGGFGVPPGGFPPAASSGSAPRASGPYQAYAERLFPRFGWGAGQANPLISLWDRESGWSPIAQNPVSTAFGIAQFLDSTWAGFGPKTSDPYLQILYGEEYIRQRYGSPAGAWGHEVSAGWYDHGGYLPPGLSLAMNGTGRPEPVGHGIGQPAELIDAVDHVSAMLGQVIRAVRQNAGDTASGVAQVLGGVARDAMYRSEYSPR